MIYFISLFAALYSAFSPISLQENGEEKNLEYRYYSSQLCIDDVLEFGNKAVQFKGIVSDSRCPKGNGVACIWAGNVKVLVAFFEDGKPLGEEIIVGHDAVLPEYVGLKFNFTDFVVTPYPEAEYRIQPEEYSVYIQVREKVASD